MNKWSKYNNLSEAEQKRLTEIMVEHTKLAKESGSIPKNDPNRAEKIQEINKKIEKLREERRQILGEE